MRFGPPARLSPAERATLGLALGWTALCLGPGHTMFMHLVHPLCIATLGAWAAILGRRLVHTRHTQRAIDRLSRPATIADVRCRVIPGSSDGAFSIGLLHPQIYIGEGILAGLDDAERSAVLLHEEHHRRTFAPLRAVAIGAWLSLAHGVPVIGQQLRERLADLEANADRFAVDHGVAPQTVASALLKMPPALAGTAFAGHADARIRGLVAAAQGRPAQPRALHWEWLPVAASLYGLATCLTVTLIRSL